LFSTIGTCLLILFVLLKPAEYFEALRGIPLLHMFLALALFGFIVDLRLRKLRPDPAPQLMWVILFVLWMIITLIMQSPGLIVSEMMRLLVPLTIFIIVAHGFQTFRAFQLLAAMSLAMALFVAFVGVHQGFAPLGCFPQKGRLSNNPWDGRYCVTARECFNEETADPGVHGYVCEHIGLFGTQSIGGRVRYLGTMEDPNELALAIGVCMPFAFAFFERKKNFSRIVLLLGTMVLVSICSIFSQSRGGQLVFLAVLGVYFVRRFGIRGLIFGAVLAVPVLLLGGRDSEEAASSSLERLECWDAGLDMFRSSPIFGVGLSQFTEHWYLTAHNSFVLAAAELGFPGMFLWCVIIYYSVKIPVMTLRLDGAEANVARVWGLSMIAAWIGMVVGVFLLSFCYKELFWFFVGLSGALYACVRTHRPNFEVKISTNELLAIAATDAVLLFALRVYTRSKI
jgi:O-antigen ligase